MAEKQKVHKLENRAPRPGRRSKARALYDAIEACGGVATLDEILGALPAADDADKWSTMNAPQVMSDMGSVVYAGYLVHDEVTHTWRIAPVDYYQARRKLAEESNQRSKARLASEHSYQPVGAIEEVSERGGWTWTIRIHISPFAGGVLATAALFGLGLAAWVWAL